MRSAIGLDLWTGQIADSARLLSVRLARVGARSPKRGYRARISSAPQPTQPLRHGMGAALGLVRRLQTSYKQDFSPAGRGQRSLVCELDRGSTLKQTGGGLYRQMEVMTMAVLAILIGVCAVALVFLVIFFLRWGWPFLSRLHF